MHGFLLYTKTVGQDNWEFNSFTATNDYTFGMQMTKWPSHFLANK